MSPQYSGSVVVAMLMEDQGEGEYAFIESGWTT